MLTNRLWVLGAVFLGFACTKKTPTSQTPPINTPPIQVADNGRYFIDAKGSPFFYLADTGWELFHRLDRNEAEQYLENRKQKGFNVIQAVAISERDGINSPNAYGDLPLVFKGQYEPDTTAGNHPNDSLAYDYWDHVEYIVDLCEKKNLLIGLLPCWGEYVTPRFRNETVFADTAAGYRYGWFIANQLKKYKNIIWILGGDRLPDEHLNGPNVWKAMAEGITDATTGEARHDGKARYEATCITYHCFYPSSVWFSGSDWIDFHTWGSYHEKRDNDRAFEVAKYQWKYETTKPSLNSEPAYEMGSVNYDHSGKYGYFDDFDVRQQAYWSVFAGGAGHTYGCGPIWLMFNPDTYDKNAKGGRLTNWKQAMDAPGATQMGYLKRLIESRDMQSRVPDQSLIAVNTHDPMGHVQACRGKDYAFIYIPTGKNVKIALQKFNVPTMKATWFNPRSAELIPAETIHIGTEPIAFDPPGEMARGNDWVLIVDVINQKK